jgi:uncharacterized damage-inducible protein DinB
VFGLWAAGRSRGRPSSSRKKEIVVTETKTRARSQAFADELRAANEDVIRFVESCDPQVWERTTAEEGWTLSMGAAHIAVSHLIIARWLHRLASGLDITEGPDDFDAFNAADQRHNSHLTQAEVVERLQIHGAALERFIRGLDDDQLDTSARFLGGDWSCAGMIEQVAHGHVRTHLEHLITAAR